jgi:hypothetical protein
MTEESRTGGPVGPPWSVDVLADLHAGALDAELSARLWPRVNADPEAHAVIEALDIVKVELGQLGAAPAPPMPAHFAARLDAALRAETARLAPPPAPAAPVVDLAAARRRRNRRLGWGVGVLTAAAAAVAVTFAVLPNSSTGGNPVAGGPPPGNSSATKPPLQVEPGNWNAAIGGVNNERDYGPLKDQQGLDKCVEANGIDPSDVQTVGVRQVTFQGRPGIMAVLTTGQAGRFRILIVEPSCGPGNPAKIVNTVFPS